MNTIIKIFNFIKYFFIPSLLGVLLATQTIISDEITLNKIEIADRIENISVLENYRQELNQIENKYDYLYKAYQENHLSSREYAKYINLLKIQEKSLNKKIENLHLVKTLNVNYIYNFFKLVFFGCLGIMISVSLKIFKLY